MRLVLAGALAAALVACSDDDAPSRSNGDPTSCYGGQECRVVQVPQVHGVPGGPTLGLKVVIGRTATPSGRAPIVYLEGGPGGSVESAAAAGFPKDAAAVLGRDFVLIEQRGNALSNPALDCDLEPATDVAKVQACTAKYSQLGYRIEAFNTVENAHDLEDLRVALGVPKLVLWGGSYGGLLAQTAARLHPSSIAGMLLESSAMTGTPYRAYDQLAAQPDKLEDFLAWLTATCATNEACRQEMPGLDAKKELEAFSANLATAPFTVAEGLVLDSAEFARVLVLITMYSVPNAVLVIRMMYASNHASLDGFDAIRVGDESARERIARIIRFEGVNRTSNRVYDCYDLVRNWTDEGLRDVLAAVYPKPEDLTAAKEFTAGLRAACGALPASSVPQSELAIPTSTDVPALFFHGALDWPTPLSKVIEGRPRFTRSQLISVRCAGHGVASVIPECFASIASTFFAQSENGTFTGEGGTPIDSTCAATFCAGSPDTTLFVER